MSKLKAFLGVGTQQKPQKVLSRTKQIKQFNEDLEQYSNIYVDNSKSSSFNISDTDLEKVKNAVNYLDERSMNAMTREQIIIGMYGEIKDPSTGERFTIPYLDFSDSQYTFKYADMMKTLVHKPETFKKIMNWE